MIKDQPIISICIPTFNREKFLEECLESIVMQFKDREILNKVEIIIGDNNSIDKTEYLVSKYRKKYKNIYYYKNKRNLPIAKGIINVGKYAKGKYIWFCSDDDAHASKSLSSILKKIDKFSPSVIFCNLNEYSRDMKKIVHSNSLGIDKDYYIHNRKELYDFLNERFFYAIDWYTSAYSNLILKKDVFDKNYILSKKYNSKYDLFPEALAVFYTHKDYDIYASCDKIIKYRSGNVKWRPENKKDFLIYWDKLLTNHYKYISSINQEILPLTFKLKLKIKRLIRLIRLYILLPLLNY